MMLGSLSETAMSSIRPPMLAGPMERNRNFERSGSADALITGGRLDVFSWAMATDETNANAVAARGTAGRNRRRMGRLRRGRERGPCRKSRGQAWSISLPDPNFERGTAHWAAP